MYLRLLEEAPKNDLKFDMLTLHGEEVRISPVILPARPPPQHTHPPTHHQKGVSCALLLLRVALHALPRQASAEEVPGGSVRGERANFTRLVLGCIDADFCK